MTRRLALALLRLSGAIQAYAYRLDAQLWMERVFEPRLTDRAQRRSGRSQAAQKGWETRRNPQLKDRA